MGGSPTCHYKQINLIESFFNRIASQFNACELNAILIYLFSPFSNDFFGLQKKIQTINKSITL